jgi:hypothetical protein
VENRRHSVQTSPLEERLAEEARQLREEAKSLPPGPGRDALLRKAFQDEAASEVSDWSK